MTVVTKKLNPALAKTTFWRPEDLLVSLYCGGISLFIYFNRNVNAQWQFNLSIMLILMLLALLFVKLARVGHESIWSLFRHWFHILLIPIFYYQINMISELHHHQTLDMLFGQIDTNLFGFAANFLPKFGVHNLLLLFAEILILGCWLLPVVVLGFIFLQTKYHREFHNFILTLVFLNLVQFTLFLIFPCGNPINVHDFDALTPNLSGEAALRINQLTLSFRLYDLDGFSALPLSLIWATVYQTRKLISKAAVIFLWIWAIMAVLASSYSLQYYITATVIGIVLAFVAIYYCSWLNEWWEVKSEGVLVDFNAPE
jgi:hypothetical protein